MGQQSQRAVGVCVYNKNSVVAQGSSPMHLRACWSMRGRQRAPGARGGRGSQTATPPHGSALTRAQPHATISLIAPLKAPVSATGADCGVNTPVCKATPRAFCSRSHTPNPVADFRNMSPRSTGAKRPRRVAVKSAAAGAGCRRHRALGAPARIADQDSDIPVVNARRHQRRGPLTSPPMPTQETDKLL